MKQRTIPVLKYEKYSNYKLQPTETRNNLMVLEELIVINLQRQLLLH